uniref:RNA 2',3'-cyclic phosphodiesterase n=1 Tax=Thermogladius calderae TaxID=1200300 RepID=A0A7J3XZS1_9CREN
MPLHRIFIAVDITDMQVVANLVKFIGDIVATGADVKPVEENLHVTIRFIGEVGEETVSRVCDIVKSLKQQAFTVHVTGVGAFPSVEKPRVVWAGVAEGSSELGKIHEFYEGLLRKIGLQPDREEFIPHITLARVRSGRKISELTRLIVAARNMDFGVFRADKVVLKESFLTPRGPIYRDVCEVELGK